MTEPCPSEVVVEGVTAGEPADIQAIRQRALEQWNSTRAEWERRARQTIHLPAPVCGLVFTADWHVGGEGVDYYRLESELDIVAATPNLWACFVGDVADNFVVNKLLQLRLATRASIPDEYWLTGYYLGKIAPRLVAVVGGNHDWWTAALSGVDLFGRRLASIAPGCLYDPDQIDVTIELPGGLSRRLRMRHKWLGNSIYNATHGQERGQMLGQTFDIAVGAHTHRGGYVRGFSAGGRQGLAVLAGTYKVMDRYAVQAGFPRGNGSTAVTLIFDGEVGAVFGVESLEMAAKILTRMS